MTQDANPEAVLTVGHSTRPIEEFLELLRDHGVERLVDVRTIPRSRYNPQFNSDTLAVQLRGAHIAYTHLKTLGGLRHARADSRNLGWRNASFRGYADYMQTPEFEQALLGLLELAARRRCAVMCAEAVPWRCHRSLIADALVVRGVRVEHILGPHRRDVHQLTSFAKVRGKKITYPGGNDSKLAGGLKKPPAKTAKEQLELQYPLAMARKRKPKFTAVKEAKRQAREAAGSPPAERVIPDKRRKPPKHKKSLEGDL